MYVGGLALKRCSAYEQVLTALRDIVNACEIKWTKAEAKALLIELEEAAGKRDSAKSDEHPSSASSNEHPLTLARRECQEAAAEQAVDDRREGFPW